MEAFPKLDHNKDCGVPVPVFRETTISLGAV